MKHISNEEALSKVKEIHQDKYAYDKFEYNGYDEAITLTCPIHGDFQIKYSSIVQFKRGCPQCSCTQHTTESWIESARKVHGDKYDYSKVDYKNSFTKVCIICPIHGEFWQLSNNHLQGQGCPKCYTEYRKKNVVSNGVRLTTEEFIRRAKEIHGDKYDYSKVEYKNAHTKVCIICPEHGEFWQVPNSHLKGVGCAACSGRKKLTTEEFVERARKVHIDKYDYSKVEYINNNVKVCIICPVHGDFWQTPTKHIDRAQGCPLCAHRTTNVDADKEKVKDTKDKLIEKRSHWQEHFENRGNQIHNYRYDYSKVAYSNVHTEVCIICPTHGDFWMTPANHIHNKSGCPKCNQSQLEYNVQKVWDTNNIKSIQYYRDSWLGMLSLDFYIPQYNIAIECQGLQHFEPTDFGGKGIDNAKLLFESQIDRDLKKIELCKEHGITLLHYATCEVPKDFDLYEVITSEEELTLQG